MPRTRGHLTHSRPKLRLVIAALLALVLSGIASGAQACPEPQRNGPMQAFGGQQLRTAQRFGVTAGGRQDLASCATAPGQGQVRRRPDITLNLTGNLPGYDLQLRVEGQCDTVLLINGPNGQWAYNDDTAGLDPAITIARAPTGMYDIWVGTYGGATCAATLVAETTGGAAPQPPQLPILPQPPQILPLPQLPRPPLLALCPNPAQNGQMLRYDGQDLWTPQRHGVVAGGTVDLANCAAVPGQGRVARSPDFTVDFTRNRPGYDLEFRVEGQCDTVLLVNGPNGQWSYNDDSSGLNPRLRFDGAAVGQYDIWVGTYGGQTCQATLIAETFGGSQPPQPPLPPQPPQPPQAAPCPDYRLPGQVLNYSGQGLWTPQSQPVIAGGNLDLAACGAVPGHGHIVQAPDFSMNLTDNIPGYDLEFRVTAACDTVLLINDARGHWSFSDDDTSLNPRIRLSNARVGQYDIWVGTFGAQTCQATLTMETFGGAVTPPPPPVQPPVLCPDPMASGRFVPLTTGALMTQQRLSVVAGGPLDLGNCPAVAGHGHTIQSPDFSLQIGTPMAGYALELGVDAVCDPVMLVYDPAGQWPFNDAGDGLNSRLTLGAPQPGIYDVWVGTYGAQTCQGDLLAQLVPVAAPGTDAGAAPGPANLTGYRDRVGQSFAFTVTGVQTGALWGTGIYTDDSSLARAAVHAGLLQVGQTGVVTVQVLPGQDSYQGSDQNGAHSSSYGRWNGSYAFVLGAQPGAAPAAAGTWQLTANAFPGVLTLSWDGTGWRGSVTFAAYGRDEQLEAISYDPITGIVQFTRPIPGAVQVYRGALSGGQISGMFNQAGGGFVYPWSAMP